MAREALAIVGSIIGSNWGPVGSAIGAQIGSYVGGLIEGPIRIPHPGLSDAPAQTSRDGVAIPIIWGIQYVHGNIIQKNPEVVVTTTESQGKGERTEVETQRRFRTFAIGICEGPIAGILRIWENNKLVYDTRAVPAIPAAETAAYAEGITIYLGGESQLADPELEAHWTAAETPFYRGLCYIVWNDKDLTDIGGAIPQFAFEVTATSEFRSTSHPYALEWWDGMDQAIDPNAAKIIEMPVEGMDQTITPQSGLLGGGLVEYIIPSEGMDQEVTPEDGLLGGGLVEYTIPDEGMDQTVTPEDGLLNEGLVQYIIPPEGMDQTITPNDGTLT